MTDSNIHFNIAFKHIDATEPLREYATEKLENCLNKFVHQETKVHLVLEVEKHRQIAEISLHSYGTDFTAKEESENMYKSIDGIVETIGKQLRRRKDKVTAHH